MFEIAGDSNEGQAKDKVLTIFGIYFCNRCRNMMAPYRPLGSVLEFKCQSCGVKQIDFKERKGEECMLFNKDMKTRK
jgi:DNA-directed RNA polymerase subunit M/transcription elongation factor TFIIS